MKMTFKLINEQKIHIINNGKVVGRIVTPSGTSRDRTNAIQVCGFENLFEYYGCGVFRNPKNKKEPKRDIQILFSEDSEQGHSGFDMSSGCGRCFYPREKCKCKDLRVKNHR